MTTQFLSLASAENREKFSPFLERAKAGWAEAQAAFLQVTQDYVDAELLKAPTENIHAHEAGGQWRIAFPHLQVTGESRLRERLADVMKARKAWTDQNLYHGWPDCEEVHHEIETFIFFQVPLFYAKDPGWEVALDSIVDVAHHLGNWVQEVPPWYSWSDHGFVSIWLGTREVRDYAPYDYQEANHFRFIDLALAAYRGTGEARYLELAEDYASRWCSHIEGHRGDGRPIPCSMLPSGAQYKEMGFSGISGQADKYQVFYCTVSDNTAYDVATALLDLYRVTGVGRYLDASEAMFDQFLEHIVDGRPAEWYGKDRWALHCHKYPDVTSKRAWVTSCGFLPRYALQHDIVTGSDRYRKPILASAGTVDEDRNRFDQMMADLLVAAHFYTGDPGWLQRACAMAIRAAAVNEANDEYHQCSWHSSRQGVRFLMELLYQPIVGGPEWGTRGNAPIRLLSHVCDGREGLPPDVSFRSWRNGRQSSGFEAANLGTATRCWSIHRAAEHAGPTGEGGKGVEMKLAPGERVTGTISHGDAFAVNVGARPAS